MSKRRVFDIDFPADPPVSETPAPDALSGRRGPMATAIGETADALTDRQTAEAAIRAENDALAHEHVRLKKAGLITDLIPLDQIWTAKLVRDRTPDRDDDIDELKDSIRAVGLSNPIRVEQVADDRFELIQGFRRLTAYRELFEETGDPQWATIPAGLTVRGEALDQLYRRMVDENMVRRDISFAEMAQLAMTYSTDPETNDMDVAEAVDLLYASAGRQKRSYIRRFAHVLTAIGPSLLFPEAMSRALGLRLHNAISDDPDMAEVIESHLIGLPNRDAEQELALLDIALSDRGSAGDRRPRPPKLKPTGKTVLRLQRPEGPAKLVCTDGKLELQLNRDFGALERPRLEAALAAFLDALDEGN